MCIYPSCARHLQFMISSHREVFVSKMGHKDTARRHIAIGKSTWCFANRLQGETRRMFVQLLIISRLALLVSIINRCMCAWAYVQIIAFPCGVEHIDISMYNDEQLQDCNALH